jgi:type 1 glutamine amidotransferase
VADCERFTVRVCESPQGLSASTFAPFALVVVNTNLAPGSETQRALAGWVATGKGLVLARGALATSGDGPLTAGGAPELSVRFLDVTMTRTDHPHAIVRGMIDTFRMADALPGGLTAHPGAEVIATTCVGEQIVPVVAISALGQGRVVALGLGRDASAMHRPQFRALLARASEWAASGAVTLPPALEPYGPGAGAVRALLITGGHDHEAAFYSLLGGHKEIGWLPVDTAANAFKRDIRGQYDVIIMYDFTRELDDACKKNLRDFVESGKGVVVLHHALLNYQDWTWWSEDVVGGRYRLRREGASPSSSVKDHQEIDVTPVATHPVLGGIHPFHITDEAYKNLYMSPRIKPLLTTDNPTSDTNLAWIGPCETSRVVAIQLGHGHSAFGHPSYQTLVYNAVLWAARHPAFRNAATPVRISR